ncbi:MAG: MnhB domain-containing protein [Ignisphaera sp.]|uniref:Sodium:proton antiporter n=1 Tax=Ignisphaera aggregans TaxID=334771 RepID=A0A7C4JIW7_9CREN
MKVRNIFFVLLMIFVVLVISIPTLLGAFGTIPPEHLRSIAKQYLFLSYNPYNKSLWSASPEVVAAIVWDYRGLDTLYETMVFYTAIIGALMLYSEILGSKDVIGGKGLSFIVKRGTAIVLLAILAVGISTVLHGMITPGGGFQGGAIMAVAPIVALIVFSRTFLDKSKLTYAHFISIRSLALLGVILAPLIPLISNAFIFQNQAKSLPIFQSPIFFTYPSTIIDVPMGGLIAILNIFEGIAVFSAFALAFMILLYSEELSRKPLEGEDIGY